MTELTSGYLVSLIGVVVLALVGGILSSFGKARWWQTFVRHSDRWACLFVGMLAMGLAQQVMLGQSPPPPLFVAAITGAVIALGCANSHQRDMMVAAETRADSVQYSQQPDAQDEDEGNDIAALAAHGPPSTLPSSAYRSPHEPMLPIGASPAKRQKQPCAENSVI